MKNRCSSSSVVWSSTTVLVSGFQKTTPHPQHPSSTPGVVSGSCNQVVPLVERPPPAGQQPQTKGMKFKKERVHALVWLARGDVGVPAGLGSPRSSARGAARGGGRLRRASMIWAVTSSRISVWLGIVLSFRCPPVYNLTDLATPRLLLSRSP